MEKITTSAALKEAIRAMEAAHASQGRQLKEQLLQEVQSLKPLTFLRKTMNIIESSPGLRDNIINTFISLSAGFVTKKLFTGTSVNKLRRLAGSALQLWVIAATSRNPETVKSIFRFLLGEFLPDKRSSS